MIRILVCIIPLMAVLTNSALSPPERSYKILMLLPVSSKSHRNVFMPLAEALIKRGHKVTMLSNNPLEHPTLEHYQHGLLEFNTDNIDMFEAAKNPGKEFEMFKDGLPAIARKIYDDPSVKKLYARREEFDLFIIDSLFNNVMYPFAHEKNLITISTAGLDPAHSALMGNLLNPAYMNNLSDNYKHPYSFIDRVKNLFLSIFAPIAFHDAVVTGAQVEISKIFPQIPPLVEIEANQSLTLLNDHFSLRKPMPLLPGQVEIGGMHCRPAKPLPKEIDAFLSGNTPVIYVSFGSIARSETMPKEFLEIFKTTFSKLPYKILWKFEDENIKGLPKNVMIKKWMPQQDVLAHQNVKVFITHCGLLSIQEAIYHGTPLIGLPIFGDQPKNAKTIALGGIGQYINWNDLTVEKLTEAINNVVAKEEYQKKVAEVSTAFRDQLEDPTERAVFWTEYVIRHNGAQHLRSPERDLTWVQLLHLDVLLALHLILYLVVKIIKKIGSSLCGNSKQPSKIKTN